MHHLYNMLLIGVSSDGLTMPSVSVPERPRSHHERAGADSGGGLAPQPHIPSSQGKHHGETHRCGSVLGKPGQEVSGEKGKTEPGRTSPALLQ